MFATCCQELWVSAILEKDLLLASTSPLPWPSRRSCIDLHTRFFCQMQIYDYWFQNM